MVRQLKLDEGHTHLLASQVLLNNTSVDDILFGAYDKQAALAVCNDVITLLNKRGLEARKWASNGYKLI